MTMEIGLWVDFERNWMFLSPFISKSVYLTASTNLRIVYQMLQVTSVHLKLEFDNVAPESVNICCVN